ncbi:retrovirus-related pol polyprotein from transposon TNT 1-94 [Tanacetum coccineum]
MTTLTEYIIVVRAENRPSMLEKSMYDSWASRIYLFIKGKKNGRMMLDSIDNGPLVYPVVEENRQTRPKKYSKLTEIQQLQDNCDVQATNIILHGLPPYVYALVNDQEAAKDIWDKVKLLMKGTELLYQERKCRLYNLFDKMTMQQVQVNTKFLNTLPSEWIKFVTDVKLAKSLYTTNYDQLYAYLSQHERHANEVHIMHERYPDPLALESQNAGIQDTNSSAPNDLLVLSLFEQMTNHVANLDKENQTNKMLNKIKEDFGKRFVTQKELSAEQAFWLKHSNYNPDTSVKSHTPVRIEAPSELPKVSLVNESLKKLKYQLASFDKVVKKRTTSDAITTGAWGFEHTKACFVTEIIPFLKVLKDTFNAFDKTLLDEITEVQTVFNQMEAVVDQCSVDKNAFEIQIKQLSIDNDQLLKQIMSQEIVHIAVNSVDILNVNKSCVDECNKCLELETGLLKKKGDYDRKRCYDKTFVKYLTFENHCISLELTTQLNQEIFQKDNFCENQNVPTFNQLFEINELKAHAQEKDTVIRKLKDRIKSLSRKDSVQNVKKYIDEIEIINIDIENELRKLKGKNVVNTAVSKPSATIAPGMFKLDIKPISHRLKNNRDAHEVDLEKTIENTDTLRIVSLCLKSCPSLTKPTEKLVVTLMNKEKKVRFAEPVKSSSNIPKQIDPLRTKDSNKPLLTFTGVNTTTSASRSKPSGNTQKNRISRPPSSNQKKKLEEHPRKVKSSLNKTNSVSEPISNVHVKHSVRNAKFESICAICCPNCSMVFGLRMLQAYGQKLLSTHQLRLHIKGLGHNLFSMGQFCDSDLEVAFRKHTCFIRDLEGVDLLKGSRGSNLYTLSMENLLLSSPICLLSKASKTKSWLWHRRLSHLNFDYITSSCQTRYSFEVLSKTKVLEGDHLCYACALGKSKKHSHKPKVEYSIQEKLYLMHMDFCRSMRIQSINGRKYILVIVDDYSWFTWVKFLRSKDEVPKFVIKFLKMIQVRLNATIRNIRTDNGTEFVYQTLRAYYEEVRISHQTSVACSP